MKHRNIDTTMVEDPQLFFDNLITSNELLDSLGRKITRSTLQRWCNYGCPRIMIGRRMYFQKPKIVEWIKSNAIAG